MPKVTAPWTPEQVNMTRAVTMQDVADASGYPIYKVNYLFGKLPQLHRLHADEIRDISKVAESLGFVNTGQGKNSGLNRTSKKTVTMKDVAALAGVVLSSVSGVLQGDMRFSKEMKKKVQDAAKQLGYKPTRRSQLKRFFKDRE